MMKNNAQVILIPVILWRHRMKQNHQQYYQYISKYT